MDQPQHSATQSHGFYVIEVSTGSVVQYRTLPLIESTLGLDRLSPRPDGDSAVLTGAGASAAGLHPAKHPHFGR